MAAASEIVRNGAVRRKILWQGFLRLAPLLLAIFFGILSLRGVAGSSIADYDPPRHALNGAFVLDLFRHGKVLHPVQFGYWYYSRLPALSLPYHPPVFPAIEALAFAVFGVSPVVARLTVAVAT